MEDLKRLLDNPTEASRTRVRIEDIVKLCAPCEHTTVYACGLRSLTSRQPQAPQYHVQDTSSSSEDIRQQTVDVLMSGFDEVGCDQLLKVTNTNDMDGDADEFSCLPTRKSTDANTCQLFGMDVVVPRSRSHWKKLLGENDASYFTLIPGIVRARVEHSSLRVPPFPIMSSSFVLTTENSTNNTLKWWRAIDDGDGWLRDAYLASYPRESWDGDCENCWLVGE